MSSRILAAAALVLASGVSLPVFAQDDEPVVNSIGMEFVLIEPGTMQVGVFKPNCPAAPGDDAADPNSWTEADIAECNVLAEADATEGFPVELTQSYYMGKFEVTQAQWTEVMGSNPSIFQGDKVVGDSANYPVDNVTWDDANAFVAKLNDLESTEAYRLPTEFEWEWACRAGGPGQQPWADVRLQANIMAGWSWQTARSVAAENYNRANAAFGGEPLPTEVDVVTQTIPVGSMQPNGWGLHDMLGNVWEWTADGYNGKMFADPQPVAGGDEHVLKGGGLAADVKNAICATHGAGPGSKWDVGFRIVKDAE